MIISHKYKYLFIELPHTASTAVSQELRDHYDGHQILWKHSPYHQFLRTANAEEKSHFVFSCIRNPLDVVITEYFRIKTNHEGAYTDPKRWAKNGGWVPDYQLRQFNFIQDNNADFATFFKRFHKSPYDNWSCLAHKQFDFVIRFEDLQSDFAKVLKLLGIEQKRALPSKNKTGKKQDFLSYYTPEVQEQAKRVFGPFMKKWDYDFPPEWGDNSVSLPEQVEFDLRSIPLKLYWRYLKSWKHLRRRSVEQ